MCVRTGRTRRLTCWLAIALALASIASSAAQTPSYPNRPRSSPSGKYGFSDAWPTGIHAHMHPMFPEHEPVCRALTRAANLNALPKPLRVCREPPLNAEGIAEVSWQPLNAADPIEVIKELYRAEARRYRHDPSDIDRPEWAAAWKWRERLATGDVRVETATIANFRTSEPVTHLLRLTNNDCGSADFSKWRDGSKMAVVEGDGFTRLLPVFGLGRFDSAFGFADRGYLLGVSHRDFDDSSRRRLREPQQEIFVYRSFEGPGATQPASVVAICRLLYQKKKR